MITPLTRKQTVILRNLIVAQQQLQENHVAAQKLKNDQVKESCCSSKIASNVRKKNHVVVQKTKKK